MISYRKEDETTLEGPSGTLFSVRTSDFGTISRKTANNFTVCDLFHELSVNYQEKLFNPLPYAHQGEERKAERQKERGKRREGGERIPRNHRPAPSPARRSTMLMSSCLEWTPVFA